MNTLRMYHRIEASVPFTRKQNGRFVKEIMEAALERVADEERRFTQALEVSLLLELEKDV